MSQSLFSQLFPTQSKKRVKANLPFFLFALGTLAFITGIIGVVSFQSKPEVSLDLRQKASVANGTVVLTSPQNQTTTPVGSPYSVDFQVNTASNQTDGIQLVFNIVTNTNFQNDLIDVSLQNSNLTLQYSQVQRTSDGFLISLIATPAGGASSSFVTNQPTNVFRLTFTPTQAGTIAFNFDTESSISTAHASNPPQDILDHVDTITITVGNDSDVVCTYTYSDWSSCNNNVQTRTITARSPQGCVEGTPVLQQACTTPTEPPACTYTYSDWSACSNSTQTRTITSRTPTNCTEGTPVLQQSCSVGTTPTCTYTFSDWSYCSNGTQTRTITSRTPTNCTEGAPLLQQNCTVSTRSCNDFCNSNSECPVNYRCYDTGSDGYRCRLVTNPSNAACYPAIGGTTTLKSCNQSCGSSAECATGLMCWNGTCRNPLNAGSSTCSGASTTTTTTTTSSTVSCNQSCTSNRDCAVNHTCSNYRCRLATNPGSSTCSPSTNTNVSDMYAGAKGDTTPSADQNSGSATPSAAPVATPYANNPDVDSDKTVIPEDETALQAIQRKIADYLQSADSRLALGLTITGVILVLFALWYLLLGAKKRNSDEEKKAVVIPPTKPTPVTTPKMPFSSQTSTNPMIERLKKQQSASQK